jgi:cytochrome c556
LSKHIPEWFPAGTGPESGFKTNAKPEIWSDHDGFMKQYDAYAAEADRLVAAAAAGDTGELTGQYYTTGVACANCHKPYRVKME